MSDWRANANWPNEGAYKENHAPMVQAQNDIFMVCPNTQENLHIDNVMESLEKGIITRAELQRNAKNVFDFLLTSLAMQRLMGIDEELVVEGFEAEDDEGEAMFEIEITKPGWFELEVEYSSESGELAQLPLSVYFNNMYITTLNVNGTNGETKKSATGSDQWLEECFSGNLYSVLTVWL